MKIKTKSVALLMLSLMLVTLGMTQTTVAITVPDVAIDVNGAPSVPGRPGYQTSFNIYISNVTEDVIDLYGWELQIDWNDGYFDFVSAEEGPLFLGAGETFWVDPIVEQYAGVETVTLACTLLGAIPGVLGEGVAATVTVYVTPSATVGATFDIHGVKLRNSALDPIEDLYGLTVQDGQLVIPADWDIGFPYGEVDIFDLVIVAINWGKEGGDIDPPEADVNDDGVIDIIDLAIVAIHYGPYTL